VSIAGLDIGRTPSKDLAKSMAILRQENHITMRLRVRDLVGFGRFPHSGGHPTTEDLAHIEAAMDQLDLAEMADSFLDELSGGQRQRAYIAMVLAQDTDYLLLDGTVLPVGVITGALGAPFLLWLLVTANRKDA
jgi:iron complex transport system ATP-binding protein